MANTPSGGFGSAKMGRVNSTLTIPNYGDLKIVNGVIVSGRPEQRMYALTTGAASIDAVSEIDGALGQIEETAKTAINSIQSRVGESITSVRTAGVNATNELRNQAGKSQITAATMAQETTDEENSNAISDLDEEDQIVWENGFTVINSVEKISSGSKTSASKSNLSKAIAIIIDNAVDNFRSEVSTILKNLQSETQSCNTTIKDKKEEYLSNFSSESDFTRTKTQSRSSGLKAGSDAGVDTSTMNTNCQNLSTKPLSVTDDGIILSGSKSERQALINSKDALFDLPASLDSSAAEKAIPYLEKVINAQIENITDYGSSTIIELHELVQTTIHAVKEKISELDDLRSSRININNPSSSTGVTTLSEYMAQVAANNPVEEFAENIGNINWDSCFSDFDSGGISGSVSGYLCVELGEEADSLLDQFETILQGFDPAADISSALESLTSEWLSSGNSVVSSISELNSYTFALTNVCDYFTGGDFGLSSSGVTGDGMAQAFQCLGLGGLVPGFSIGYDLSGLLSSIISIGSVPSYVVNNALSAIDCLLGTLPEFDILDLMNLFPMNILDSLLGILQCLDYNCNSSSRSYSVTTTSTYPTTTDIETTLSSYGVGLDGVTDLYSIAESTGVTDLFTPEYCAALEALKGTKTNVCGLLTEAAGLGYAEGTYLSDIEKKTSSVWG